MNFVADESCAKPVVLALREAGHDVLSIAEVAPGATDQQVLERALNERRVLITEDRDLVNWFTHADFHQPAIILVRVPSRVRRIKPATVIEAVSKLGLRLRDTFTVVEPGRVRMSCRP